MVNRRDAETRRETFRIYGSKHYLLLGVVFILLCVFAPQACSIPNLEPPECDQARDAVRELYSYHFGDDLRVSGEQLNRRVEYLTPGFLAGIHNSGTQIDPLTLQEDPPKAFRAGECKVLEPGMRTTFEVLLFWRDDVRNVQRTILVELVNDEGRWLVDRVSHMPKAP